MIYNNSYFSVNNHPNYVGANNISKYKICQKKKVLFE